MQPGVKQICFVGSTVFCVTKSVVRLLVLLPLALRIPIVIARAPATITMKAIMRIRVRSRGVRFFHQAPFLEGYRARTINGQVCFWCN